MKQQRTSQLTALDTNILARYYVQAEQTDAGEEGMQSPRRPMVKSLMRRLRPGMSRLEVCDV